MLSDVSCFTTEHDLWIIALTHTGPICSLSTDFQGKVVSHRLLFWAEFIQS